MNPGVNRSAPASGTELLQRMHDMYDGQWYKTLTFVQKRTLTRPTGVVDTSTWYEALKSPDRLRIDFGDPSKGNGALYTADSLYVVRGGKITRTLASGNPFLPFVAGVYDQPMATTLRQLAPYNFDFSRIRSDTWQGKPVYVVGAKSADDLESPQFWIDRDRLIAVRFLVKLSPAPDAKPNDIRLESYVPVGGGWLATHVAISGWRRMSLLWKEMSSGRPKTTVTGGATHRCRMISLSPRGGARCHTGSAGSDNVGRRSVLTLPQPFRDLIPARALCCVSTSVAELSTIEQQKGH